MPNFLDFIHPKKKKKFRFNELQFNVGNCEHLQLHVAGMYVYLPSSTTNKRTYALNSLPCTLWLMPD